MSPGYLSRWLLVYPSTHMHSASYVYLWPECMTTNAKTIKLDMITVSYALRLRDDE